MIGDIRKCKNKGEPYCHLHAKKKSPLKKRGKSPRSSSHLSVGNSSIIIPTINGLEEKYEIIKRLGEGQDGVIFKAKKKSDGTTIAIKLCPITPNSQCLVESILRRNFFHHDHENIVKTYDIYENTNEDEYEKEDGKIKTKTYVVEMELCKGDLFDMVYDLTPEQVISVMIDITQAVKFIHEHGIMHRDIKPENILICNGIAKLADFGHSTSDKISSQRAGTPQYVSPEVAQIVLLGNKNIKYNNSVDIWTLGIMFYELLTKRSLFDTQNTRNTLNNILIYSRMSPTDQLNYLKGKIKNAKIAEIIHRCLSTDPEARFTADELLLALKSI